MKAKLLIIALALPLVFGCEKAEVDNGKNEGQEQGGNAGGYDPDTDDPMTELPPLADVDDVCTKMTDRDFMKYCYENFDVNKDGKVSMLEANAQSNGGLVIDCNTASDFTGIEYFTNLTEFSSSSVKAVNLGYNKKLVSVNCSEAPIETIDLRHNTLVSSVAFRYCSNLSKILLADESPIESIGSGIFTDCESLVVVSLPDNCKRINSRTFSGCTSLLKIKFPKNLESIGASSFSGCNSLTSVSFPAGLTSIGESAFKGCSGLTSVTISDGLTSIEQETFSGCSGLTSVSFPAGLTSIGSQAFRGCTGLTSLVFSESLTEIGSYAFVNCASLTSLVFPKSLTKVEDGAFGNCTGLTSVKCFATRPPQLPYTLYDVFSCSAILYVPAGCVEAYKNSNWREYFDTIVAIEE